MQEHNMSNTVLARKLGVSEAIVRRFLDLDHNNRIGHIDGALHVLGHRLEISVLPMVAAGR